ncbi:tetratricopeptide repeat protein 37 [Zeugodacus cucurbitae]|uniref:Tetratricopeptide repeat protein 37 n=1 Tax=Zeugodacus cucurbitae TaxID=28588 RepID=A0A0A1XE18_ZEUCU|nr:tetratricopeptide repeat protein 37 [Zeugodacus cucurbitae]
MSKESKTILKEVREAIKNEKFNDAIEKCEALLRDEPKNYMAYLLLGAAYQNSNKVEAAKYLRKAVEFSPAAPTVALQGLANCAPQNELPKIYEQLIDLVPEKFAFYFEKLYGAGLNNRNVAEECFNFFKRDLARNEQNEERHALGLKYLARIWILFEFDVHVGDEPLYKIALEKLIADTQDDQQLNAYKRYLKLLYKNEEYTDCFKHACEATKEYPEDIYAYEWVCKIYCEVLDLSIACLNEAQETIEHYVDALLQLNPQASLGLLIRAFKLFEKQHYVAARDLLYRVQELQPKYGVALELLARVEMLIGVWGLALPLWKAIGKDNTIEYAFCLSHVSSNEEQSLEAIELLKKFDHNEEVTTALARCYFKIGDMEKLKELNLNTLQKAEFLLAPEAAIKLLQASDYIETFDVLFLLSKLHLKLTDYASALNCMLKATRLQPYSAECFHYLGKIYYHTKDLVRARKCFEKCVNLNPLCESAVNNLSAIYQQLGEEDLNVALLINTLKYMKTADSKRIHYKLGLHYFNVKKYDEAIQSFRTAIKLDVNCMNYWESLGDAYSERGSYYSAIRVFQKLLEMCPSNIYAKLQMALLKSTIRMYPEAIADFDELLQTHPDYLPGLKGAAEAHVGLANNMKLEHLYGRCKEHLQLAVNYLQRAFLLSNSQNMFWLWRLTANVFVQTARMPSSLAYLEVSGKLAKLEEQTAILSRKDLYTLAARFYTCAIKLKSNTFIWYEFALCSYYCALNFPEEASAQLELSTKACKMAINEQGGRWQNWNLLGVINLHEAVNNLPLAQHCFIQALTLDRKSFSTWTNLGVLYLMLSEIKLANQAFQRAQQSSPIYGNAWIGQAMIAEAIGEEEEALDLFRHCQQFEYHPESSLGYAHWVCNVLTDEEKCKIPHYRHAIENMYADVVALDAINWHIANEEKAATTAALSLQGFLNIRHKHYGLAERAYLQAVEHMASGAERDKLLTNLGYLYLEINRPNDAINVFNRITHASFKAIIGLALAFVRAGQHQEAYSVYNSVLKTLSESNDDKAGMILVAMAAMVYASQGEADTKTILYQCILLKNSPIQALYSACALGILHQDNQLTTTILTELKKYENCEAHCAHISYLTAQHYASIQQARKGLNYLLTRVHIFPHNAELRKVLANYLLDHFSHAAQYQVATSQIALSSISLLHRNKTRKSDCIEDSKLLLIASRALSAVNKSRSLKLIQHAIRLHPQNQHAWLALQKVQ